MCAHAQLVFCVGFALMVCLCAGAFFVWLVWNLFFDSYDNLMQRRTRRRNRALLPPPQHSVGRDCFRDNYREWTRP